MVPSAASAGLVAPAHHVAVAGDGVFAFKHLHHHRLAHHEIAQFAKERTFAVHRVEAFGLLAGHVDALAGDDAQAGFFQHRGNRAGQVAAGGVGLDDRKGAGNRHVSFLGTGWEGVQLARP